MNRKLHNTLVALSTTGLLAVAGLLAATPAGVSHPAFGEGVVGSVAHVANPPRGGAPDADEFASLAAADLGAGIEARVEARLRALEQELGTAGSSGEAIASTAAFIAGTATEAALAGVFAGVAAEARGDADAAPVQRDPPRKRRTTRSKLALPYFSFAHGLRRNGG